MPTSSDPLLRHLADEVRRLRVARGWSQEKLAEETGLHWTHIGKLERGEVDPSVTRVARIAAVLGLTVSELLGDAPQR